MAPSHTDYDRQLHETQQMWDAAAASFDNEPDHGLRDPVVRETWTQLLETFLPAPPATVLDAGCGTGSLSVILAGLGHQVVGIDLSPAMISRAKVKATALGHAIPFHVMDAAAPWLLPHQFDVIICRHLLWALPDPRAVLLRWADLLKENGRLALIEGHWQTGAGLRAQQVVEALPVSLLPISLQNLSDRSDLWGGAVTDERYALIAELRPAIPSAAA
jgi:2-polyprenyl-3-methyl-5-hydroxy-6-metoxy-1,4-benzoquinol methylase